MYFTWLWTYFTDEPDILITGEDRVVCGDSARFDAEVKRAQLSEWSITWQKKTDDITIKINTSDKKYKGSSRRQLVIQSVCKDDKAEYQAILSNGSKLNIISNIIYLQALGGIFYLGKKSLQFNHLDKKGVYSKIKPNIYCLP